MILPGVYGLSFFDDGIAGSPQIDGPFPGMQVSIDIGSGNSLTVLSVSEVPVPAQQPGCSVPVL